MSDYKPITGELREKLAEYEPQETGDAFVARQVGRTWYDAMIAMCNRIDAVHAGLERENAELKAKLDRVLGKQEEHAHTRGESITGELREYALGWDERNRVRCDLTAIADCIDAEHERQLEVLYRDMSDAEYVKLPVDADGEYIHVGDVLDGYGKTIEVVELRYGRSGWVLISRDGNAYADTYAFSHRQPDSWERIIEDAEALAREWFNTDMSENEHAEGLDAIVARCKALCERTNGGDAE